MYKGYLHLNQMFICFSILINPFLIKFSKYLFTLYEYSIKWPTNLLCKFLNLFKFLWKNMLLCLYYKKMFCPFIFTPTTPCLISSIIVIRSVQCWAIPPPIPRDTFHIWLHSSSHQQYLYKPRHFYYLRQYLKKFWEDLGSKTFRELM